MRGRGLTLAAFITAGLVVAVALALFVSPEASSAPDGLNKVAIERGFADREQTHALADAPTAGYAVRGVDNERLSTGIAGVLGVTLVFATGFGLFAALRRHGKRRSAVAIIRGT